MNWKMEIWGRTHEIPDPKTDLYKVFRKWTSKYRSKEEVETKLVDTLEDTYQALVGLMEKSIRTSVFTDNLNCGKINSLCIY